MSESLQPSDFFPFLFHFNESNFSPQITIHTGQMAWQADTWQPFRQDPIKVVSGKRKEIIDICSGWNEGKRK